MFRRTRYQQGSLVQEERKRGSAVWVFRWWEKDINGMPVRRKLQIGSLEQYPNESAAQAAADALRLTINNPSGRRNLRQTTVNILWEHYCREELPLKGDVHARRIQRLYKELDSPKMGQRAAGRIKDRRGGTLAARSGRCGWDQSQDQVRDVGFVFARRSLGVLWSQSDLVGDSGRKWRKERSKHWRTRQCKTSKSTSVLVTRASDTWSRETRISAPVTRVSGWSVRDSSRRARCPALVGTATSTA